MGYSVDWKAIERVIGNRRSDPNIQEPLPPQTDIPVQPKPWFLL